MTNYMTNAHIAAFPAELWDILDTDLMRDGIDPEKVSHRRGYRRLDRFFGADYDNCVRAAARECRDGVTFTTHGTVDGQTWILECEVQP